MAIDISILEAFAEHIEKKSADMTTQAQQDHAVVQNSVPGTPHPEHAPQINVAPVPSGQATSRTVATNQPNYVQPKPATQPGEKLQKSPFVS